MVKALIHGEDTKQSLACGPWRLLRSWNLAPALLATLAALALVGCSAAAPVNAPKFPAERAVFDQTYLAGRAIRPLVLPAATGGSGTLRYSLEPSVPPGLEFDAVERTLTGTPTTAGSYPITYVVRDANGRTDTTSFSIVIQQYSAIGSIVSEVTAAGGTGVLRLADVPEPGDGPAVAVTGNHFYVAGGLVFLDIEPMPGAAVDKLIVSIGEEGFGYYEIDVPDAAGSYRLVGEVPFDMEPLPRGCLSVSAVDAGGAVGAPACHEMIGASTAYSDVQVTVSWDTDADLDLHVADPTGHEVYSASRTVESGGVLFPRSDECQPHNIRNERIAWTEGTPPPGRYEVRLSHYDSCEAEQTNYVLRVYNHGTVSVFNGTLTGPGDEDSARGTGQVVTTFEVPGEAPPEPARALSSSYRGSGDQVFVLNPNGEVLDQTLYTLNLGSAAAEVYVVATAGNFHVSPQIERLDRREAAAKGLQPPAQAVQQPEPRPAPGGQVSPRLRWITEFNNFNDGPPVWEGSAAPGRIAELQAQPAVAEGDRIDFYDAVDKILVPATVRKVVTDGTTRVALWVADQEWADTCASRGDCVTQEMVDAVAERFLRPGASNDIHDWITAIFGAPWGPHSVVGRDGQPLLIPAEAAREIHVFAFDIQNDGYITGSRIVGYFTGLHNRLRQPDHELLQHSLERLAFFMDSPWLATASGDTWEVTDRLPKAWLGTLAHEFQHMIHFYQKPVLRDTVSETWLNEAASEVAEDLVADKMMNDGPRAVAYDDPAAGDPDNRRGRLPQYNLYNDIQVTTWDGYLANYSVVYAFGAYLARNYGGAALFSDLVQSDRAGVGAVEGALRNQGHDESFLDLLTNWAAATLLSDNAGAPAPYRYNTGAWRTSFAGGTEFRLGSINLYNYIYAPGRLARPGPFLHPLPVFNERTQPPHSNMYTTLGRHSGTLRLSVSAEAENRITVVVKE
ncbi:MAG: putative Ig domain-containing protein [Spirochaetaceae bacterium]|nr:putative Ig domain-containing protein [Spirochaetaceae bacterium]